MTNHSLVMETLIERGRGFIFGFVLAQFVSAWISYPLCILGLLLSMSSPVLLQWQRLKQWFPAWPAATAPATSPSIEIPTKDAFWT